MNAVTRLTARVINPLLVMETAAKSAMKNAIKPITMDHVILFSLMSHLQITPPPEISSEATTHPSLRAFYYFQK
jgi:hypothetical protein